jgi:phosphoglycerate dehydrogenase-like enzyme
VGISRSHLFDPRALASALTDGRIEACMLDGAESGFASKGTPLHEIENLFLTPRLGSHTRESRLRASWYVAHRMHETLSAPRVSMLDSLGSQPMELEPDGGGPGRGTAPQFIIR